MWITRGVLKPGASRPPKFDTLLASEYMLGPPVTADCAERKSFCRSWIAVATEPIGWPQIWVAISSESTELTTDPFGKSTDPVGHSVRLRLNCPFDKRLMRSW